MENSSDSTDIRLDGVTKVFRTGLYRKKVAVDNVSFSVRSGEVLGLLGPNGSGKSTTLKMILGFLRPTSGSIHIRGRSPSERRSRELIGYLPENPRFPKFLSGKALLEFYGSLLGLDKKSLSHRIEYLLELVRLSHAAGERTQGYSKGMIQRLAVAQALLASPPLLIFDEPMSGLDPLGRVSIREIIQDVHREFPQTTIFFSTHVLSDAERVCSSVLLLKKGKLKRYCQISDLLKPGQESLRVTVQQLNPGRYEELEKSFKIERTPLGAVVTIPPGKQMMAELQSLSQLGVDVVAINSERRSLEEALFGEEVQYSSTKHTAVPPEVHL